MRLKEDFNEFEDIRVRNDNGGGRSSPRVRLAVALVLGALAVAVLAFSAFGNPRGLYAEHVTAHKNGQTVVVHVAENFDQGEVNANLLAAFGGYSVVVYGHCSDLDTALAFNFHQEPDTIFLIDEKAPANGSECLAHIDARYLPKPAKVICLVEKDGSSAFRQICRAATYMVVDKDSFLRITDRGKLEASRVIELLLRQN